MSSSQLKLELAVQDDGSILLKSVSGIPVGSFAAESFDALAKSASDPILAAGYAKLARKAAKRAKKVAPK